MPSADQTQRSDWVGGKSRLWGCMHWGGLPCIRTDSWPPSPQWEAGQRQGRALNLVRYTECPTWAGTVLDPPLTNHAILVRFSEHLRPSSPHFISSLQLLPGYAPGHLQISCQPLCFPNTGANLPLFLIHSMTSCSAIFRLLTFSLWGVTCTSTQGTDEVGGSAIGPPEETSIRPEWQRQSSSRTLYFSETITCPLWFTHSLIHQVSHLLNKQELSVHLEPGSTLGTGTDEGCSCSTGNADSKHDSQCTWKGKGKHAVGRWGKAMKDMKGEEILTDRVRTCGEHGGRWRCSWKRTAFPSVLEEALMLPEHFQGRKNSWIIGVFWVLGLGRSQQWVLHWPS